MVDKLDSYNNTDCLDKCIEGDRLDIDKEYDWSDNNNDCDWLNVQSTDMCDRWLQRGVKFRLLRSVMNEFVVIERNKWKVPKMIISF